ncbi:hypothetical protein JCM1840_002847 [Sporobolomyces johnsonii]
MERLRTQRAAQQAQRDLLARQAQQPPPSPIRDVDCVDHAPPSPHPSKLSSPTSTASRRSNRGKRQSSEPETQRKKLVEEEGKGPSGFAAPERPQTGWEWNADSLPFVTDPFSAFSPALDDAFGPGADVHELDIDQSGWSPFSDPHPIPRASPRPHATPRVAPSAPPSPGHSHASSPHRHFDPSSTALSPPFSHQDSTRPPSVSSDVTLNEAAPRLITSRSSSPRPPLLPPSNPPVPLATQTASLSARSTARTEIEDEGEGEAVDLWALREERERAARERKLEWERARREAARADGVAENELEREEAQDERTEPGGAASEVEFSAAKDATGSERWERSESARGWGSSERAASRRGGTSPLEPQEEVEPQEEEYVLFEGWLLLPPTSASTLPELTALPPSSWIPHYVLLTSETLQLLPPTDGQPPAVALILKECDSIDFAPELPIQKDQHFFPWAVTTKDGEKVWFVAGSGREWLSWTCHLRDAIDVAHGRPLRNPLDDSAASDSDSNSSATLTSFSRSSRISTAPTSASHKSTGSKKGAKHLAKLHHILADYEAGLAALGSSKHSSTRRPSQTEDWMRSFNRNVTAYPVMHELYHDAAPDDWSPTSSSKLYRPPTPAAALREKSSPLARPASGLEEWSPRTSLDSHRPPNPGPSQDLRPDPTPLPASPLPPQSHLQANPQPLLSRFPLARQPANEPILPLHDAESLLHIFNLLKQRHDPVNARLGGASEEAIRAAGARLERMREDLERKMRIEGGVSSASAPETALLDKIEYLIHLNDARLKKHRRSISVEGRGSWVRPTSQQEADLIGQIGQRIAEILELSRAAQARATHQEMPNQDYGEPGQPLPAQDTPQQSASPLHGHDPEEPLYGHLEQQAHRDEPEREWTHIEYLQALFNDVLAGFDEQQYRASTALVALLVHHDRKATKEVLDALTRTVPAASAQLASLSKTLEATLAAIPPAPAPAPAPGPALAPPPPPAPVPAATPAQLPRDLPQSRHHLIPGDGRMAAKVVPAQKAKEWSEGLKPVVGGGKKVAGVRLWGGPDPIPTSRHVPRWAEGAAAAHAAREVFELVGSLQSEKQSGKGKGRVPPIVEEMMHNEWVQAALKGFEMVEGGMDPAAKALAIYEIIHEARERAKKQKASVPAPAKKPSGETPAKPSGVPARANDRVGAALLPLPPCRRPPPRLMMDADSEQISGTEGQGEDEAQGKPRTDDDKQTKQALVEILERWKPRVEQEMGEAKEDLAAQHRAEKDEVEKLRQQQAELQARLAAELKAKAEAS